MCCPSPPPPPLTLPLCLVESLSDKGISIETVCHPANPKSVVQDFLLVRPTIVIDRTRGVKTERILALIRWKQLPVKNVEYQ
jgi:hypothetical protein